MKNNLTELVFILDASGSMFSLTADTIGGFNSMIRKQRDEEGTAYVTTVTFDDRSKIVHDRIALEKIAEMTEKEYSAGGSTALLDAMGDTIKHIEKIHKYIRKEDVPEKTLFVITTDGMENASHKYSSDDVKKMVEAKKEEGWDFIFMGANIDAVETAAKYGIAEDRAVEYLSDKAGTAMNFCVMNEVVGKVRRRESVGRAWKDSIEQDVKKRK